MKENAVRKKYILNLILKMGCLCPQSTNQAASKMHKRWDKSREGTEIGGMTTTDDVYYSRHPYEEEHNHRETL